MPLIRPKKRLFQKGFKQINKIVPKGVNLVPRVYIILDKTRKHSMLLYSLLHLLMFLYTRVFPLLARIRFLCFACVIEGVGLNPCLIEKSFRNVGKYDHHHSR